MREVGPRKRASERGREEERSVFLLRSCFLSLRMRGYPVSSYSFFSIPSIPSSIRSVPYRDLPAPHCLYFTALLVPCDALAVRHKALPVPHCTRACTSLCPACTSTCPACAFTVLFLYLTVPCCTSLFPSCTSLCPARTSLCPSWIHSAVRGLICTLRILTFPHVPHIGFGFWACAGQVDALHELGPDYQSTFRASESDPVLEQAPLAAAVLLDPKDGLAARLLLSYNAQVRFPDFFSAFVLIHYFPLPLP